MQLYIWSCQHGILVQHALSLPGVLAWSDNRSEPSRQKARTATAETTDCRESFHMIIYIYICVYNTLYISVYDIYIYVYIYICHIHICIIRIYIYKIWNIYIGIYIWYVYMFYIYNIYNTQCVFNMCQENTTIHSSTLPPSLLRMMWCLSL